MINCRLRTSLYRLFTGDSSIVSRRKMVIPLASIQSKGFESLKQQLHTSSDNDDDFAELGLPLERGGVVIPQLKTEKPASFKKISNTKTKQYASFSEADSFSSMKGISFGGGISSSVPSLDLENRNDEERTFKFRPFSSVTIKNVPSIINLLELKEAISVFGKVLKASKRSVPSALDCCDIEFKSVKSRNAALLVGSVTVKNFNLPICSLDSLETVTITISNISSETTDSAIHSTCSLCGCLEGLVRMKEDVVDALFSVKGETDTKSILNKLNSTAMDESKWSAYLQCRESHVTTIDNGSAQDDLGLKISAHLAGLRREILMKNICTEDLENLHNFLLHLENQPHA